MDKFIELLEKLIKLFSLIKRIFETLIIIDEPLTSNA